MNVEEAKLAATCSECLARTYRGEECVCADGGDAENYHDALAAGECVCGSEGPDYFGNFDRIPNPSCPIHES